MGLRFGRALTVSALVAIAMAPAAACRTRRPTGFTEAVVDEPDRFPHASHAAPALGLGCRDCHGADGDARPGADDHAPCDRCHATEFQTTPGPLCRVCHTEPVDVTGAEKTLRPFPLTGGMRAMPARFAHETHLDPGRMEKAVGFNIGCTDCHALGVEGETPVNEPPDTVFAPAPAGHVECGRCHAAEVALERGPAMGDCAGCHDPNERAPRHPRVLIAGDLHFDHRNHRTDAGGKAIPCRSCHAGAGTAKTRADHPPPSVRDCVTCHDDSDRVPQQMRMQVCETCHATRENRPLSLAPRDHLPLTERPQDHTLAFRIDHGEAARNNASRCATCHTQLSGATVDTCDECHQVMRPRDHVVTFRELDHGGLALADSDRCATCHVVDYCADCHRQRPRSHLGGQRFAQLEHGDLARINVRSCLTCHAPDRDCTGSGCHTIGVPGP
jgi:hypothetical protein